MPDSRERLDRLRKVAQGAAPGEVSAAVTEATKARRAAFFALAKKLSDESKADAGAASAAPRREPKWPPA